VNRDEAAVLGIALPLYQATPFQVVDHHGDVAGALEDLPGEIPLTERAAMKQSLEHAELADREPRRGKIAAGPGVHRLGCPHQLDVAVQGPDFFFTPSEFCRHIVHRQLI
jgi:hypothetical protein